MKALKNAIGHFKTITTHRNMVCRFCFKAGLYKQGLKHDLSKYSPVEFMAGVRFYQGDRSPNDIQRRTYGYSAAWLHHKGRNRHHYEYWTDYIPAKGKGVTGPVPMPRRYIAEMVCDRLAACHVYNKGNYVDTMPLEYFNRAKARMLIEEGTRDDLEMLLTWCYEESEEKALAKIKNSYLRENGVDMRDEKPFNYRKEAESQD